MPRMSVIQQREPLSVKQKILGTTLLTAIAATAVVVGVVASPILLYCAPLAVSIGTAVYTQDRWITRAAAAALSLAILSLALAILFPPALCVMIPLMAFCTSGAFTYGLGRTYAKIWL